MRNNRSQKCDSRTNPQNTWARRWMNKLHETKKNLRLNVIYGMILLIQFLCYYY